MSCAASQINAEIWRSLYSEGKNDLRYPNDVLVRVGARLFGENRRQRILDFGFGTGANLAHFAGLGFEMHGVEISEHALARTEARLNAASLPCDLRLISPGDRLPYDSGYFDAAYAWQVLYYSDRSGWKAIVDEMERVTKPGGQILVATAAPGDVSQVHAENLGNSVFRSAVPHQKGCIITVPEREEISQLFPGRQIEVGEFGFTFRGSATRFWIINYVVLK